MRDKYDQAEKVLGAARKLAKGPEQIAVAENRLQQVASIRSARDAAAKEAANPAVVTTSVRVNAVPVQAPPKHPVELAKGPKHTALGAIRDVHCDSPSYLELQVQVVGKAKPIALYTSDYYHLDLSALGFEPKAEMNPCRDLDGVKAKVLYAESSDKTIDGQIVSIELHK
jgi:hypothetical protein